MKRNTRNSEGDHGTPGYAYKQNPVGWFLENLDPFSKPSYVKCFIKIHDF